MLTLVYTSRNNQTCCYSRMSNNWCHSLFAALGTATRCTSETTAATSEATATALEHHLHHCSELSKLGLLSTAGRVAHTRLVFSLLYYSDLTTLEQALIVHLGFHDWVFLDEFDIGIATIMSEFAIRLPFGLAGHLVDGDGHSVNFSTVAEMLLEVVHCGWEMNILDEDGSLVGIVPWWHSTTLSTSSLILIYLNVRATRHLCLTLLVILVLVVLGISCVMMMVIAVCRHS